MASILVFLHHNGNWEENYKYNNFKVCGLAINPDCNYSELKQKVAEQLKVNTREKGVVLKYQVKDGYPPIVIKDDASLEFYKLLKTKELDYTMFPVCTSIVDFAQLNRQRRAFDLANDVANAIVKNVDRFTRRQKKLADQIDRVKDVSVGHLFENVDVLKGTIKFWAISENFNFMVVKSSPKQYCVGCVDVGCGWFVKASCVGQSCEFMVRSMHFIHTCPTDIGMDEQRQATAQVVSNCIKRKYCDLKTTYTPAYIIRDMKDEYGVESKNKAVDEVNWIGRIE